jgi:NADP-dependent 3-hydroxy acid dehydrogenase YdfG
MRLKDKIAIVVINLRGCIMAVKHVLPVMRAQRAGVILTISSLAAYEKAELQMRRSEVRFRGANRTDMLNARLSQDGPNTDINTDMRERST